MKMKRSILLLAAAFLAAACVSEAPEAPVVTAAGIASPDGRLNVTVLNNDGSLEYKVEYDGQIMMTPSPLGFIANYGDFSKLRILKAETDPKTYEYTLDRIKTSSVSKEYNGALLECMTPDSLYVTIELRASNNDFAFRYVVPKAGETGSIRVMDELTGFAFPEGTTTFLTPQSDAMIGWKRTKPSYEEYYGFDAPMSEESQYGHGYTFPCLFHVGDAGWVLVSETGVDSRYCGSRLGDCSILADGSGLYKLEFPMAEENNGNGTVEPAFALPGATPWRTITVAKDLAPIVETTVTWDLVTPRYSTTHKYHYDKGTWSWILWQDQSINFEDQKAFIDLSAALGFKYSLVDNWWDTNIGKAKIEELVKYARKKNIDLFLWYSSSGWWNDIEQGPINIMSDPILRKPEMEWLEKIGVKGIKVDFFGGDKQETMRHYESILSDADDHGLMVIFHGCTIPRGWERMYPNYVGSEAVRASENLVFNQRDCDTEALYATLHPYVRNSLGCMEFGGCFLNKVYNRANEQIETPSGRKFGSLRRTTEAFELATAVLFQNPIQNFALAPNNLKDAPKSALAFLRDVPTTWDETRYIDGYPGKSAVVARRNGKTWYVAAVTAGCYEADSEKVLVMDPAAIAKTLGANIQSVYSTTADGTLACAKSASSLSLAAGDGALLVLR